MRKNIMQISNEIIKILEYLGEQFGITIDWTNNNVVPYVEELCKKIIEWEISTSFAWIVVMIGFSILSFVFAICMKNLEGFQWFCFWVVVIVSVIVISCQVFDIIECRTFPEKTIYDYINTKIGYTRR